MPINLTWPGSKYPDVQRESGNMSGDMVCRSHRHFFLATFLSMYLYVCMCVFADHSMPSTLLCLETDSLRRMPPLLPAETRRLAAAAA